ncbi:MAG TPA: hypothetical protein VGF54_15420, partial [Streptosporangiaceae bacterium]
MALPLGRAQCASGNRENAGGLVSFDPSARNAQIILRSSLVSIFFTDRTPSLNARVSAARQTRLGIKVCMPGLGPGG